MGTQYSGVCFIRPAVEKNTCRCQITTRCKQTGCARTLQRVQDAELQDNHNKKLGLSKPLEVEAAGENINIDERIKR